MDYLDAVFKMWLAMLQRVVDDDAFGAIFWVFILVLTIFNTIKIWRGVKSLCGD